MKSQEKHSNPVGRATVFTHEEELQFVAYTVAVSNYGFPGDTVDLRLVAKAYLDRCAKKELRFKNNYPGKDWAEGFMTRHKAVLTQRAAKNISHARAATDENVINSFFDHLERNSSKQYMELCVK